MSSRHCQKCGITVGEHDMCYCDYNCQQEIENEIPDNNEVIIKSSSSKRPIEIEIDLKPVLLEPKKIIPKKTRRHPEYYEASGVEGSFDDSK